MVWLWYVLEVVSRVGRGGVGCGAVRCGAWWVRGGVRGGVRSGVRGGVRGGVGWVVWRRRDGGGGCGGGGGEVKSLSAAFLGGQTDLHFCSW